MVTRLRQIPIPKPSSKVATMSGDALSKCKLDVMAKSAPAPPPPAKRPPTLPREVVVLDDDEPTSPAPTLPDMDTLQFEGLAEKKESPINVNPKPAVGETPRTEVPKENPATKVPPVQEPPRTEVPKENLPTVQETPRTEVPKEIPATKVPPVQETPRTEVPKEIPATSVQEAPRTEVQEIPVPVPIELPKEIPATQVVAEEVPQELPATKVPVVQGTRSTEDKEIPSSQVSQPSPPPGESHVEKKAKMEEMVRAQLEKLDDVQFERRFAAAPKHPLFKKWIKEGLELDPSDHTFGEHDEFEELVCFEIFCLEHQQETSPPVSGPAVPPTEIPKAKAPQVSAVAKTPPPKAPACTTPQPKKVAFTPSPKLPAAPNGSPPSSGTLDIRVNGNVLCLILYDVFYFFHMSSMANKSPRPSHHHHYILGNSCDLWKLCWTPETLCRDEEANLQVVGWI